MDFSGLFLQYSAWDRKILTERMDFWFFSLGNTSKHTPESWPDPLVHAGKLRGQWLFASGPVFLTHGRPYWPLGTQLKGHWHFAFGPIFLTHGQPIERPIHKTFGIFAWRKVFSLDKNLHFFFFFDITTFQKNSY